MTLRIQRDGSVVAVVDLPYTLRTGRVSRGRYQGMHVADARAIEVAYLRLTFPAIEVQRVTLRPWWALWRRIPAVRLVATHAAPAQRYTGVLRG